MSPARRGGCRGAEAGLWDDELQFFATGILRAAVQKLLLARSTKAEAEAWRTLESNLSRRLIEQLGCDAEVILFQIRLERERRKMARGK